MGDGEENRHCSMCNNSAIFRSSNNDFRVSLTSNEENVKTELLIHQILEDEIRSY